MRDAPLLDPETGLPVAVTVVLRRADGRYLLIRRGAGVAAPGYWAPVSGRIEPGEAPADAARREVAEEVGLIVARVDPEPVHRCPAAGRVAFTLWWLEAWCAEPVGPITPAPREVAEARWLRAAEAAALTPMFEATRAFFIARAAADLDAAP